VTPRTPREEFLAGSREVVPMLIGTIPFGLVAGVAMIASGLTAVQGFALSVLSFSGIAQLIVCQLLAANSPVPVAILAGSVVSLRFVMYSAAVSPHIAHLGWRKRALMSFLMVDQSFSMTTRYFSVPGDRTNREWHTIGACATFYVSWQAAVAAGIALGSQLPTTWSLDFAVVLTFISLLVPAVRTRADLGAAIVAAAIALVAAGLPYRLALVAASVCGIVAGMSLEAWHKR
jgi:4-azaleucine resistance transporter AzlC